MGDWGRGRARVSAAQLDALLAFMEEHPALAGARAGALSRYGASRVWRLLSERLNAAARDSAGVTKSPDKWCRFWADLKYKARRKGAGGAGGAGGALAPHEARLAALLRRVEPAPAAAAADSADVGGSGSDSESLRSLGGGGAGGPGGGGGGAGGARTEELLAEAAMRSALAHEKTAEAALQAVAVLRDLLAAVRALPPPPPPPPPPAPHPAPPHAHGYPHPPL